MAGICRLCLSFSTQDMVPLSECNASVKIVLNIHIPSNGLFPNQVCTMCLNKLTELNEFILQVKKNEQMLIKQMNQGLDCLEEFYKQTKDGIKKEGNEPGIEESTDNLTTESNMDISDIKMEEDSIMELNIEYNPEDESILEVKEEKCIELETKIFTADFNFKCLTCSEKFENQQVLVNHYNNVHKSKVKHKTNYTLMSEDDKIVYKCDVCDKTYDNKRKISKHSRVHSDERFHCKICSRTYKTVSEIIRHGRAHDGTTVSCSFGCGFATAYSGALKNHEDRHRKDFKYKCKTCNKSFQVKTWFHQHQNIHKGIKPYLCNICGLAFHMDRYLTAHRSAVHPNASVLNRYVCVQCSKPFGTTKALVLHLREHGIMSSLLCDLCGKSLSSTEQLKKHKQIHLDIRPYRCTLCGKTFTKKYNLKLHEITHTGVRAHACDVCGKQYTQRATLVRHVNRSHAESTKNCSEREEPFASETTLESHQKMCS